MKYRPTPLFVVVAVLAFLVIVTIDMWRLI